VRVMFLENSGQIYSSNVHLLLGNWSRIGDVNTLVDVGRDLAVPAPLADAPTAVGKRAVEQVVLTHGHQGAVEGAVRVLQGGDELKVGDRILKCCIPPATRAPRCWPIPATAPMKNVSPPRSKIFVPGTSGPSTSGTARRSQRTCSIRLRRSLEIVSKSLKRGCGMLNTTRKVNCEVV